MGQFQQKQNMVVAEKKSKFQQKMKLVPALDKAGSSIGYRWFQHSTLEKSVAARPPEVQHPPMPVAARRSGSRS